MDSNVIWANSPPAKADFEKNLLLLQERDPFLSFQLQNMSPPSGTQWIYTDDRELNLLLDLNGDKISLYCASPQKESALWFQSLDLIRATTIIVYGLGIGTYYCAAKEWLQKDEKHTLIFLEDDLSVLYRFCETPLGLLLLQDAQVEIIWLKDPLSDKVIFDRLSLDYVKEPVLISSLASYASHKKERFCSVRDQITYEFELKKSLISEYQHFGSVFYRNFYKNLLAIRSSYLGCFLFGQFKNTPAIICGAGPSLNISLDKLQQLKEKALLISGGSALCALSSKGIRPHFGVALDPHASQHTRIASIRGSKVPFFYKARLNAEALSSIEGAHLYLPGSGGYAIASWFERQLGINGEVLEEGHNVINLSLMIAEALCCDPIILVGVDCAYTSGETYAAGVLEFMRDDEKKNKESDKCIKIDIFGKPIVTEWKWVAEAAWISSFAAAHKETTIINASEGGLGFSKVPNISLVEVEKQWLQGKTLPISERLSSLEKYSLACIDERVLLSHISLLKDSVNKCLNLLKALLVLCDKLCAEDDVSLLSQKIMYEMDLESEVAYEAILEDFSRAFFWMHQREEKELKDPRRKYTEEYKSKKHMELDKARFSFLKATLEHHVEFLG